MPEILRAFLSTDEVAALRVLDGTWTPGRQDTGYDILALRERLAGHALVARALAAIGTPYEDHWDVYLIRYRDGAHIPDHVDPAQHGRRHRRLNAVLANPDAGGELHVDGALVALVVGDAVVFDPDREVHRVSAVTGIRLLFSVGAWI